MQRVSYNDGGITLSNTQNPVINIYDTSRDPVLVKISGNLECDSVTAGNLALSSTSVSSLQVTNLTALSNIQCNTLTALSSLGSPSISGTLTTSNQPNITSLGTLNNLTLTGTLSVAALAGNYASSISSLANLQQLTTVNLSTTDANIEDVILTVSGNAGANAIYPSGFQNRGINFQAGQVNIAHSGINVLECAESVVRINRPLARPSRIVTSSSTINILPTAEFNYYVNHASAIVALTINLPVNDSNRSIYVGQTYNFATSGSTNTSNTGSVTITFGTNITVRNGNTTVSTGTALLAANSNAKHFSILCVSATDTDMRWIVTGLS